MTTELILSIVSLSIPTAISIYALFVSIKNRRNGIREKLYENQLNAYSDINEAISKLEYHFGWWILNIQNGDKAKFKENMQLTYNQLQIFEFTIDRYETVLPHGVYMALAKLSWVFSKSFNEIGNGTRIKLDKDLLNDLTYKYSEMTRDVIGVNKLSKENFMLSRTKTQFNTD